MNVTVMDMRRNPRKILDAIARNETVTLTNRGKPVAHIEPIQDNNRPSVTDHEAFGMWAARADMTAPSEYIQKLRKGHIGAL